MFIYFDRNGVLQEVINDKSARLGDLNANEIYVYVDEVELDDIWLTLKRPDGTLSIEKSFIANKVVRELPYDPKRDMKFFKDYKEYEFYKFTITDEITIAGVYQATIRMTYEDALSALGVLVFKAETGVIKSDQNITQTQYDYLIWYVGSWQGQIGDLEQGVSDLENRMDTAESDIEDIKDGTIAADRAINDEEGNPIVHTYANSMYTEYYDTDNQIFIVLRNKDGNPLIEKTITLPTADETHDGLMSKEDKLYIMDELQSVLASKENKGAKNQNNGYAGLDNNGKIPTNLIPDSIFGQLVYKGVFNPNNGYPSNPEKGWFYISTHNGTISGEQYHIGDWAVYDGTLWDKVDNTDAVASVNGKIGTVVLDGTDLQVGNGDTTTIEQKLAGVVAPTASTLVQRDTIGRIKASAGVATDDVVNVQQLNNALGDIESALDAIMGV